MTAPGPAGPLQPSGAVATEQAWAWLVECGINERHFNQLQATYRALASTWLLATLGGIGFVLSKETLTIGIHRYVVISGIALAGAAGILLIWVLDILVYHRLLDAAFLEGRAIELAHQSLPQLRGTMMDLTGGDGILSLVVLFYKGAAAILVCVSAGFAAARLDGAGPRALALAAGVLVAMLVNGLVSVATSRMRKDLAECWKEISQRRHLGL